MYGARIRPVLPPHRAAQPDRERRARPRRRLRHPPARPADERLADRDPRSRLAVLACTVRRVGGPDHEPRPAGRDRPRAWHVLAAGVEPDGPVDADGDQALVIYEARHPTVLPGGEAARPWDTATGALVELLHHRDRPIPRGRPRAVARDVRRLGRWDDDCRTPRRREFVAGDRVRGGVSGDAHERALDRGEQIEGGGCSITRRLGQRVNEDHA